MRRKADDVLVTIVVEKAHRRPPFELARADRNCLIVGILARVWCRHLEAEMLQQPVRSVGRIVCRAEADGGFDVEPGQVNVQPRPPQRLPGAFKGGVDLR